MKSTNTILSGALAGEGEDVIAGPMVVVTLGLSGFSVGLTNALDAFGNSQKLRDFEAVYGLFEKVAAEVDILDVEARSANFIDLNGNETTVKDLVGTLVKKRNGKGITYRRAVLERPLWTYISGPSWAKETHGVIWREDGTTSFIRTMQSPSGT